MALDPNDVMTLRITVASVIRDEATRKVAEEILESTARDLRLKLMLLGDALTGVEISHRMGTRPWFVMSLTTTDGSPAVDVDFINRIHKGRTP